MDQARPAVAESMGRKGQQDRPADVYFYKQKIGTSTSTTAAQLDGATDNNWSPISDTNAYENVCPGMGAHIDGVSPPLPPSIWYDAVAVPQEKPSGKRRSAMFFRTAARGQDDTQWDPDTFRFQYAVLLILGMLLSRLRYHTYVSNGKPI